MPRVTLNNREWETRCFSDYVLGQLHRTNKRQQDLASYIGITQQGLSQRINGKVEWKLTEVADVCGFFGEPWTVGGRYG